MTQRRLSPWRIILAIFLLIGIGYAANAGWQQVEERKIIASHKPWFAAYVDVTAKPTYAFEQAGRTSAHNLVLSFIVSSKKDACTPSWGSYYNLNQANAELDIDRRIARLRQQNGNVVVSFGGLLNDELAVNCKNPEKLLKAYQSVIDRYNVDTVDFDLEGKGLTDMEAAKRRAAVLAKLQANRRAENKNLAIWLTLPVAPQGLTEDGTNAVAQMLAHKVDLAGVNVMTMDYSQSKEEKDTMQRASEKALIETHRQLGILYKQADIHLNSASLWGKIGATPMIGQNDVPNEIFTLEDAAGLNKFAQSKGVGRMSMWSINRDIQCGDNYIDLKKVSDSCSGVKQDKLSFALSLSENFDGDLSNNAALVTKEDPNTNIDETDDPAKSPYQIWKKTGSYLQGTKVVWHKNVYQAKWWTQGDIPDNPVLQSWQTPWQLIGPVLPNEKPIPQPTLAIGTYPRWSGSEEYDTGQRVLFNGLPYQAKWWTQGDSPAASTSNPDSSPWVALTQEQVNELVKRSTASRSSSLQE